MGDRRRVVIAGGSGLIGTALQQKLGASWDFLRLVRREPTAQDERRWDPAKGVLDAAFLDGADAIVNLAGESIASWRWTASKKREIESSRVHSTRLICERAAGLAAPPRVIVNASAIGIYGSRGSEWLDEWAPAGHGFLARVGEAWEGATEPAARAGIRVVRLRTSLVLAQAGGALAAMLRPFRLGLGGRIGDGRQYMSWIALSDLIRVIELALNDAAIRGPINAASPEPVTNAEFTRTLARVLRRSALLPVPRLAVKLLLGEMGEALLLSSIRVRPRVLEEAGFRYEHAQLEGALRSVLGR
jgi:uncharacterized protein